MGKGCCRLCAAGGRLIVCCTASEEHSLARMRALLEAHLGCRIGGKAAF